MYILYNILRVYVCTYMYGYNMYIHSEDAELIHEWTKEEFSEGDMQN